MIAVIVPAHNQEAHIGACLQSLTCAGACLALAGEPVLIIVVLDDCSDGTRRIATEFGVCVVVSSARNGGTARAVGAQMALSAGARWLAFTDAGSEVAPNWISQQHGGAAGGAVWTSFLQRRQVPLCAT